MIKQDDRYIAVIEGGGSTCRGVLYDLHMNRASDPVILDKHPCNIARNRDMTLRSLLTMIELIRAKNCPLTLCLPGISNTANVSWLRDQLQTNSFDTIHIASDAIAALLGAYETLAEGQGIFIGGTGVIALGYAHGRLWRAVTTDTEIACGPWIVRKAWDLSASDPDLKRIFESEPDIKNALPHQIARFAPAIFDAADTGNPHAQMILQQAADSAADYMNRLMVFGITQFVLCGSVACALQNRIPVRTGKAHGSGLDGALKLALSVHKNPAALGFFNNLRRIEDEEPARMMARQ